MMDTESSSGSPPINSLASKLGSLTVQGGHTNLISSGFKFPPPPRLWGSDGSSESSDSSIPGVSIELSTGIERPRLRSRLRTHKGTKASSHIPIGIFWDIENCQVPKGCSAIDVVSTIRTQFLVNRREADFIVVCDVRKETPTLLQELNDAQVSLIHVCGSQKNAADEKLRQCMRRFGELHPAPAALLLISGDINFAADLSDFRHRKNMEVILVHKVNTSPALIACASSNYSFKDLTENLPRFAKPNRQGTNDEDGDSRSNCELVVSGLPQEAPDRLSRRLKRLADNCGGRVVYVNTPNAKMRFPTPENAHRAMKRMDGEDVFGHKITVGPVRGVLSGATYSSDEGYCTATGWQRPAPDHLQSQRVSAPILGNPYDGGSNRNGILKPLSQPDYMMASNVVPPQPWFPPAPWVQPPPPNSHLHSNKSGSVNAPRMIRGAHGNTNLDQSLNSTKGNPDVSQLSFREKSLLRPISPGNSSFSEISSEGENSDSVVELTVSNLPTYELRNLHEMLTQLFSKYVIVLKVSVRAAADGPLASVMLYSESDARLAIARIHRRRLDETWAGRRLELTLGRLSPAPNAVVLRSRLRNLLQDAPDQTLPLVRLSDAYTVRHGCSLTSSDLARVKDTVTVSEGGGRLVKLLNPGSQGPVMELDDAPWKCNMHSVSSAVDENGAKIMSPVYVTLSALSKNTQELLQTHGGIVPLLSYMDCYAAHFGPLAVDATNGVVLELLLRNVPGVQLREHPSRHLAWAAQRTNTPSPNSQNGDREPSVKSNGSGSIAPTLAPLLGLLARELIDLLRTAPRCTIPFTRFIPAYHHHFGRQCRVADYGFTRLSELLAALNTTVVVLGTGCSRMITLSYTAQAKRWSGELLRLLRAQPVRTAQLSELPKLYQQVYGRPFSPSDYGVCTIGELLDIVTPHAVQLSPSGVLSLPRRVPPPRHHARTLSFAAQALDLLLHTPALRMEFPRFVPAYHMHFGRQCRVAQYGCTKLIELFELIPETVLVKTHPCGERYVHLVPEIAQEIMLKRIQELSPISLAAFPEAYAARFGGQPLPDILETDSMEKLVVAAGATVTERNGMLVINVPTDPPTWVNAALEACAILTSDRSVNAHGSSLDYFVSAYRERRGAEPPLALLLQRQVVSAPAGRVAVAPRWRAAWRLTGVVTTGGKGIVEIREGYVAKFGAVGEEFDLLSQMEAFMGSLPELFVESAPGQWSVHAGVHVPLPSPPAANTDELMLIATPPGQKGSTVFDTPPRPRWLSPLASTLPSPSAFLPLIQSPPTALTEQKRRTRLAAQFGNAQ